VHDLNSLPVNFDVTDIRRCLGGSFDKGLSYQQEGAVRDLRADKGGQRLIASVRGTRSRPYHVFVEIEDSQPVSMTARCTCPVGWNCKHAAAALIEALRKPPPVQRVEQDPLSGAVGGWLHQLRAAAHPAASPEAIVYRFDPPAKPGSSFVLDMRVVRLLKSGDWGAPTGICRRSSCRTLLPIT
jgi:SWIM zinc finger